MFVSLSRRLEDLEKLVLERTDEVLDLDGACALTSLQKSTLYQLTSAGMIPHYRGPKRLYFKKSELQLWLTSRPVRSQAQLEAIAAGEMD